MKNNDIIFIFKKFQKKYDETIEIFNVNINMNNELKARKIEFLTKIEKFENFSQN